MIFFTDRNNPTYKAIGKFRETSQGLEEASDADRVAYVEKFLEEYEEEYGRPPAPVLVERLGNFILRPYIGNKGLKYKILSVYSLERREKKQNEYIDGMGY